MTETSSRSGKVTKADSRVQVGPGLAPIEPFYCDDCNRRFFNEGWHAEACGSPHYRRLERPDRNPEAAQTTERAEESVGY